MMTPMPLMTPRCPTMSCQMKVTSLTLMKQLRLDAHPVCMSHPTVCCPSCRARPSGVAGEWNAMMSLGLGRLSSL